MQIQNMKLPKILKRPTLPSNLPSTAKWLSGEGAGSWFVIKKNTQNYTITRYSPNGNFECENNFPPPPNLDLSKEYNVTYPSHCSIITVVQNEKKIRLNSLPK